MSGGSSCVKHLFSEREIERDNYRREIDREITTGEREIEKQQPGRGRERENNNRRERDIDITGERERERNREITGEREREREREIERYQPRLLAFPVRVQALQVGSGFTLHPKPQTYRTP
jgi:hypothetical protein